MCLSCAIQRLTAAVTNAITMALLVKSAELPQEVVLQLINSKCLPVLLYGLEVCPLSKSDLQSLDFVINQFLMKLFKTANMFLMILYLLYL